MKTDWVNKNKLSSYGLFKKRNIIMF